MTFLNFHDTYLSSAVETITPNRPDFAASQLAVMLFAHSETNPAFWRMVFSCSVSESSSQTIRIRAPSGTFNVKRERVLLSPVDSRVCVRRLNVTHPSFLCSRTRPNPDLSPLLSEKVANAWEPLCFKRQPIGPGPGYVVTGQRQSHSALPRNVSTPPRLPG